jgi:hypothetical protein
LIAIVADAGAGNAGPRRPQTTAMDSAIRQLTASLTPTGDPSRPVVPPTIIDLGSRPSVEIPPPDPSAPP